MRKIANKYKIDKSTLREMLAKYECEGKAGLDHISKNRKYNKASRLNAVEEYFLGKVSQ